MCALYAGKLIRILLSRMTGEEKKEEGKAPLEGQHMARLVSRSPTAFEVSGMKETARS